MRGGGDKNEEKVCNDGRFDHDGVLLSWSCHKYS